jgi:hypothetical protein
MCVILVVVVLAEGSGLTNQAKADERAVGEPPPALGELWIPFVPRIVLNGAGGGS